MAALSVSANIYNTNKLAITIKGAPSNNRQAVHLIFLIDVSGSMEGHRLESVKKSLEFLLPLLTENDMVTLIEFGDESDVLAKAIQMDAQGKAKFQMIINRLRTKGCTNMSSALLKVSDLFKDDPNFWASPGHKHGVLLLTDGHANRGVFNPDGLMTIIAKLITENPKLSLTTVGYSLEHNAELLKQAATTGSGSYNIVNSLEDIATTFGEVFGGLTTVVAQNVVLDCPNDILFQTAYPVDNNRVRIGDIYAEQEIIILANSYSGGDIRVRGNDISDLSSIDITASITSLTEVTKEIEIAELRYAVAQLLKEPNRDAANTLLTRLRSLSYVSENIVQMMIEDCETVLEALEQGINREVQTEMAQHSAYLGLGRGLRCAPTASINAEPPRYWSIPDPTSVLDPTTPTLARRQTARTAQVDYSSSPFSNQTQQTSVNLMRMRSRPENN